MRILIITDLLIQKQKIEDQNQTMPYNNEEN
jgi:hypothetical protein